MGLDITGYHTGHGYSAAYGSLHKIRALSIQVSGKFRTWEEAWNWFMIEVREDKLYNSNYYDFLEREELLKYRQLLHFSDCNGVLVRQCYLEGINYKRSFVLGSLDELYQELEMIRNAVGFINGGGGISMNETVEWLFCMLYDQVKEETEEGVMLKFH